MQVQQCFYTYSPTLFLIKTGLVQGSKVSVNEFLDVLLGDPSSSPSLVWLPLLHRIAAAENGTIPRQGPFLSAGRFSQIATLDCSSRTSGGVRFLRTDSVQWPALPVRQMPVSLESPVPRVFLAGPCLFRLAHGWARDPGIPHSRKSFIAPFFSSLLGHFHSCHFSSLLMLTDELRLRKR